MSGAVLVLCEQEGEAIIEASMRSALLARHLGEEVVFCLPEASPAAPQQVAAAGGDRLVTLGLAGYAPLALARGLGQLADRLGASCVLAAATDHGNEVLAHLAAITGEEMVAGCIAIDLLAPGSWQLTRQRWGGSLLEEARLEASRGLFTVAADALAPPEPPAAAFEVAVESFSPLLSEGDMAVAATLRKEEARGVSLASARVVVSGGRGVGSPEGFAAIEEVARLLGGAVGVSRAVTSLGWRPHREQVGQTGTKVTPELYLACGISGAVQHLAGCQGAKTMVAINTDPEAPIMARADYAVIGDVNEVLPALAAALAARLGRS